MNFDKKVSFQEVINEIVHRLQNSGKFTVAINEIENFLGTELEENEIEFIKNKLASKGIDIDEFIEAESGERGLTLIVPQEL